MDWYGMQSKVTVMNQLLLGAIVMACLIISLFFLRFWRKTRDRFFLFFAAAFFAEGVNRIILGLTTVPSEAEPFFYIIRLFSFLLILVAIVDKNRADKTP
jgi:uncharacterized membrane protein HdeD (DUF308 family)